MTGISRPGAAPLILVLGLVAAGCGGAAKHAQPQVNRPGGHSAFAWLRPGTAPASWRVAAISSGASMPYPPGWKRVHGDRGTATATLGGEGAVRVVGYLNLTPRQGEETVANWPRFRVGHNAEEGDHHVKTLAVGTGLRFRTGHGACVKDSYTTGSGARYVELACLVRGRRTTSVIVGASPPSSWARVSPLIERAISATTT